MHPITVDLTFTAAAHGTYAADLRMHLPNSSAPVIPLVGSAPVSFNLAHLRTLALDPRAYGEQCGV